MRIDKRLLLLSSVGMVIAAAPAAAATQPDAAASCASLAAKMAWPEPGMHIVSSAWHEAGPAPTPPAFPGGPPLPAANLPAHCELIGMMHERVGVDGQHYTIRFHVRLPQPWNGKFFMQGGGGSNGVLGDAIGRLMNGGEPALTQGYAVLSQDSGHDNDVNADPAKGGVTVFGFDPQARADYGGTSLRPVVEAAKAAIKGFYGRPAKLSYFVGCSKGGQEGMMLAQRYPDLFDGIVAAAPGFALPRAAVAEAWNTQAFAAVVKANGQPLTPQTFADSFSNADLALVRKAVLAACDKDDGVEDGIVGTVTTCTSAKVLPELAKVSCAGGKQEGCLSAAQLDALRRVHDGARNSKGEPLYAGFYWDAGWSDMPWRMWMMGGGPMPSINVMMGAPSLATTFTVPPKAVPDDLGAKLDFATRFDMDRDAPRIYATGGGFTRSAWTDIGAQSTDLSAFRKHGGKLIVPHGASDPVFSLQDTVNWYIKLNERNGGEAISFARLFAIPGMAHCGGGPGTDGYDAFAALVNWVERGQAPERIEAKAGPMSLWPGRTRPLCAYPKVARYKGSGSIEEASSFTCS